MGGTTDGVCLIGLKRGGMQCGMIVVMGDAARDFFFGGGGWKTIWLTNKKKIFMSIIHSTLN